MPALLFCNQSVYVSVKKQISIYISFARLKSQYSKLNQNKSNILHLFSDSLREKVGFISPIREHEVVRQVTKGRSSSHSILVTFHLLDRVQVTLLAQVLVQVYDISAEGFFACRVASDLHVHDLIIHAVLKLGRILSFLIICQ